MKALLLFSSYLFCFLVARAQSKQETMNYLFNKIKNSSGVAEVYTIKGDMNNHKYYCIYHSYDFSLEDGHTLKFTLETTDACVDCDLKPYIKTVNWWVNLESIKNFEITNTARNGYVDPRSKFLILSGGNKDDAFTFYFWIDWTLELNLERKLTNALNRLIELNEGNDPFNH